MKKYIPRSLKYKVQELTRKKWKGDTRVFCLSIQRSGTTSVGDFFEDFDFPVARHRHSKYYSWSDKWYKKEYEQIFGTKEFNQFQVFEDNPWWYKDFYKVLNEKFPEAKYILVKRSPDNWFKSMVKHSGGKNLGNTVIHAFNYEREAELNQFLKENPGISLNSEKYDNILSIEGMEEHYKNIYNQYYKNVIDYFNKNNPNALLFCNLEDTDKWQRIADFVGFEIPVGYDKHSHKSK